MHHTPAPSMGGECRSVQTTIAHVESRPDCAGSEGSTQTGAFSAALGKANGKKWEEMGVCTPPTERGQSSEEPSSSEPPPPRGNKKCEAEVSTEKV